MVFKLCAAVLWGAVRNLKGAANFFRQDEILQFFYWNLFGCAAKKFWSLLGCREPKSLKTTALNAWILHFLPAKTRSIITFDRLNRFSRMMACFKGHSMSLNSASFDISNPRISKRFFLQSCKVLQNKILYWKKSKKMIWENDFPNFQLVYLNWMTSKFLAYFLAQRPEIPSNLGIFEQRFLENASFGQKPTKSLKLSKNLALLCMNAVLDFTWVGRRCNILIIKYRDIPLIGFQLQ